MKHDFKIPPIMRELEIDDRGYPIPYFVPIINGKPEFRYQDGKKQRLCIEKKLCGICGKKLYDKAYWFVSGPIGLKNRTASDAPMHEDCARFSIAVCPHMLYEKAERRTEDDKTSPVIHGKPKEIYLVKADKFSTFKHNGHLIINFRPKYQERYVYENGVLQLAIKGPASSPMPSNKL